MSQNIAIIELKNLGKLKNKDKLQMQNSPSTLLQDVLGQYTGKVLYCMNNICHTVSKQLRGKSSYTITPISHLEDLHLYAMIIVVVQLKPELPFVISRLYNVT